MAVSRFRAEVDVFGVTASKAMLEDIGRRAYNTRTLMYSLLNELAADQRLRVEREPWVPLTEGTVARKIGQGELPELIRDEARPIKGTPTRERDALYRAITVPGAPGQLRAATRTWATFGVKASGREALFYARFVQNVKGTKRKLLAISQECASTMTMKVATYITDGDAMHFGSSSPIKR